MNITNIAAYKFVTVPEAELPGVRAQLKEAALALKLKGTVLLSTEGINLFLAGSAESVASFKHVLEASPYFAGLSYKESFSHSQPFTRMLVRLKKEIISMGHPEIQPERQTAPHLSPQELRQWYEQGKDMIVLDTRNDYEVRLGSFESALHLNIKSFRDFPKEIERLPEEIKNKAIVSFCTGGVRCEKATQLMLERGFKEVYQLEGGILNYFEQCGGAHYQGECFVFDKRVAINEKLEETTTIQCYGCRNPLTPAEQAVSAGICPHCGATEFLKSATLSPARVDHMNIQASEKT